MIEALITGTSGALSCAHADAANPVSITAAATLERRGNFIILTPKYLAANLPQSGQRGPVTAASKSFRASLLFWLRGSATLI